MKKILFTLAITGLFMTVSCDPKADTVQQEDTTSEKVLRDDKTPSQYEGSTGVEDDNNNMVANENIELKEQEFKGSFGSPKTQSFVFTVLDTDEYSFSLKSDNPNVEYIITKTDGPVIQEATKEDTTLTLEPGDYTIVGTIENDGDIKAKPETEFTIWVR